MASEEILSSFLISSLDTSDIPSHIALASLQKPDSEQWQRILIVSLFSVVKPLRLGPFSGRFRISPSPTVVLLAFSGQGSKLNDVGSTRRSSIASFY